jgi:hypothetical protein
LVVVVQGDFLAILAKGMNLEGGHQNRISL